MPPRQSRGVSPVYASSSGAGTTTGHPAGDQKVCAPPATAADVDERQFDDSRPADSDATAEPDYAFDLEAWQNHDPPDEPISVGSLKVTAALPPVVVPPANAVTPAPTPVGAPLPPVATSPPQVVAVAALTVAALAQHKAIPVELLKAFGVADGAVGVAIPYATEGGEWLGRTMLRTTLVAREGSRWVGPKTRPILPYGLWLLDQAKEAGYVCMVCGESDAWTLWFHAYPALGLPGRGAQMTKKIDEQHLAGIPRVVIIRERDEKAQAFVGGVKTRLRYLSYPGEVCVLTMPEGVKDPNELHKRDSRQFKSTFDGLLAAASLTEGSAASSGTSTNLPALSPVGVGRLVVPAGSIEAQPGSGMAVRDERDRVTIDVPSTDPGLAVAWMNKRHAVVVEAGKTLVITVGHDEVLNRRLITRSSFPDIVNFYVNRVVVTGEDKNGKPTFDRLGGFWLSHRDRRQYNGILFAPGREVPGYFNLWRGFAVEPQPGCWDRMQAHTLNAICRGDERVYRWLRAWMANAVQRPDRPAEVAVVLRGRRGTGKGMFTRWFGQIFDPHFIHINSPRHLMGNFNAHLQDAIVVFADEAFLPGDRQAEGTLKMLITEPRIPIERKRIDVITVANVLHLIIASNDEWVVPAGLDERRFAVLDVDSTWEQDHTYFAALADEMEHGGLAAMLYDLQRLDISEVNLRQPPVTAALLSQKLQSMKPAERWWYDKLLRGQLLPGPDKWQTEVQREAIHDDFAKAVRNLGSADRGTQTELGLFLKRVLPDGYPTVVIVPAPPFAVGGPSRAWGIPSLADCRRHFDDLMRQEHDWPSEGPDAADAAGSQPTSPNEQEVVTG